MAEFFRVADAGELAPGQAKCVEVAGKKIALFNLEGSFYAIDDTCTHRGGPLSEGEVSGEEVTCPWHGAIYNIKTGAGHCTRFRRHRVDIPGPRSGEIGADPPSRQSAGFPTGSLGSEYRPDSHASRSPPRGIDAVWARLFAPTGQEGTAFKECPGEERGFREWYKHEVQGPLHHRGPRESASPASSCSAPDGA